MSISKSAEGFLRAGRSLREVRLELEFSRYETYEEKIKEVYRPKGLLAFTTAAREHVKLL